MNLKKLKKIGNVIYFKFVSVHDLKYEICMKSLYRNDPN